MKLKHLAMVALALAILALLVIANSAHAQTYSLFKPANGVLKGQTSTYVTTAAASSDIRSMWSGSCSSSTFLRGDGACAAAGGSPGGSNTNVQFNSSGTLAGNNEFTFTFGGDDTLSVHSTGGEALLLLSNNSNQEWRIKTGATPSLSFIYQPGLTAPMTLSFASFFANVDVTQGLTLAGSAGTTGQVFTSQGTGAAPIWAAAAAGAGGSNTQVQFNSSGSLAGSAKFVWTDSTSILALTSATVGPKVQFNDASGFDWTIGTDGVSGNVLFHELIFNVTPITLIPATGSGPATSLKGQLQFNGNAGTAGQVATSNGSSDPTWQEAHAVAKLAATTNSASTLTSKAQYCVAPTATNSITSSTTFADDTDLTFNNVPVGSYKFDAQLDWTFTNATGGVKAQVVFDGATGIGPTYSGVGLCNNVAQDVAVGTTAGTGFACSGGTGTEVSVNLVGAFNITVQGTVSVQWAQNSSDPSATVRGAYGSFCITRLN